MKLFNQLFILVIISSKFAVADIITNPTDDNIFNNSAFNERQFLQQLTSQVEKLLAEKKNLQALIYAKNASTKVPRSEKTQLFYASLLVFLKEEDKAIKHLATIKNSFPNNGKGFFMSAVLLWQQGNTTTAIDDMKKATQLAPSQLKYWLMLSQMNHDGEGHGLNVHKGSLQALLSAEEHHPNNIDLLYRIAATYDEESKSQFALKYYAKVLALDSSHNNANTASAINSLKINNKINVNKWINNIQSPTYRTYIHAIKSIYDKAYLRAHDQLEKIKAELVDNGHVDYYLAKANLGLNNNKQAITFASSSIEKGIFPSEQAEMISLISSTQSANFTFQVNKISLDGIQESIGVIDIIELSKGIIIKPNLSGLNPGSHGFHVHQEGTCDNVLVDGQIVAGGMAKGHYMGHQHHGSPAGDLPNIVFDNNKTARDAFLVPQLTLAEIEGRSFMIHATAENDANIRIACGVVK
ncbi:MAG: superoxide dismutase family protein [Colwellia sp.]|nr:superoxide dismutase family protein [Colwellia sp.]